MYIGEEIYLYVWEMYLKWKGNLLYVQEMCISICYDMLYINIKYILIYVYVLN